MSYIVDTCVIVWLGQSKNKIPAKVVNILERKAGLNASVLSIYEINALYDKKKISSPQNPRDFIKKIAEEYDINFLSYGYNDAILTQQLPYFHKDPFDRMIISQAINNNFSIISPDSEMEKYNIKTIWS